MKIKYMLLALIPLCMASCSQEETFVSADNQEVRITAGVGTPSRMVLKDQNTYTQSLWQDGDAISLFTSTQSNLVYGTTLNADSTSASFTPSIMAGQAEKLQCIEGNTVYACYPTTTATNENNLIVNIPPTDNIDYKNGKLSSFCYAVNQITNGHLNFNFKHLFAFLCVTVTPDIVPVGNSVNVTVSTSSDAPLSVGEGDTFDFSTLTANTTKGTNTVRMSLAHSNDSIWSIYIPILPQPGNADITITLTNAHEENLYTLTKQTPANGFQASNVYKLDTSVSTEVAYLVDGATFNASIKQLANNDKYLGYYSVDLSIKKIEFVTEVENTLTDFVDVSAEDSQIPIYASFNPSDSVLTISTEAKSMIAKVPYFMFTNLRSLHTINFGKFSIDESATNICNMFASCLSLTALDVSNWNTENVTSMNDMFYECSSLTTLDVTNWNTAKVTGMNNMFYGCSALTTLDVTNWNTENVVDMSQMFGNCSALTTLNVANWNTNKVKHLRSMFVGCSSLTQLDIANWNTTKVIDMSYMFSGCSTLATIDVANWNICNVTYLSGMFNNCLALTAIDVANWNTSNVTNTHDMFSGCSSLVSLNVSKWNTNSFFKIHGMFSGCSALTTIDVANWDVSNVVEMSCIFSGCTSLSILDIANWNTSNVVGMGSMFKGCGSLNTLDIANWNTGNVTSMMEMFKGCSSLTTLNVSNWNTGFVTDMYGMFEDCSSLTSLDVANWNIDKTTRMKWMFNNCSSLTDLKLTNWTFNGKVEMEHMFDNCASTSQACSVTSTKATKEFLLNNTGSTYMNPDWFIWEVDGEVAEVAYLVDGFTFNAYIKQLAHGNSNLAFSDSDNLVGKVEFITESSNIPVDYVVISADNSPTPIYASFNQADSLLTISTAAKQMEIVNAAGMFYAMQALRVIDFGNFNVNETTTNISSMFYNCSSLTELNVTDWNTVEVTNMDNIFYGCSCLSELDVANWNTENVTQMSAMFYKCSSLSTLNVANWKTDKVTGMGVMFGQCFSLKSLDVSNWNTAKVSSMNDMFYQCANLKFLDVSNWNTGNVVDMNRMFYSCSNLTTLDVSNWNTAKVTGMNNMFYSCSSLTTLDASNWNTAKVIDMGHMFYYCSSLTELKATNWDTGNVYSMDYMFSHCNSLKTLNAAGWNTTKVESLNYMFDQCFNLSTLDVSGWNTANIISMNYMLRGCRSLTMLNISDWNFNGSMNQMFNGCASTSQACEVISTQEAKEFLLGKTGTTGMNPDWFIWGDAENGGSGFDDMPKEEW